MNMNERSRLRTEIVRIYDKKREEEEVMSIEERRDENDEQERLGIQKA